MQQPQRTQQPQRRQTSQRRPISSQSKTNWPQCPQLPPFQNKYYDKIRDELEKQGIILPKQPTYDWILLQIAIVCAIITLVVMIIYLLNMKLEIEALQKEWLAVFNKSTVIFTALIRTDTIIARNPDYVIVFDHILTNEGNGYNKTSGMFTCPIAGIYVFSVNFLLVWSSPSTYGELYLKIYVNSKPIAVVFVFEKGDNEYDTSYSNTISVHLSKGDKLTVKLWFQRYRGTDDVELYPYTYLLGNPATPFNSITGYLLHRLENSIVI